jgi:16S rRNA (uracil1498-N3)-methyltransferase
MTAAFFLVDGFGEEPTPGSVLTVGGPEGRHAVTVRRLGAGEQVLIGDGDGRVVSGTVSGARGKDVLEVTVDSYVVHPPATPRVVVVQALAKGDRGELSVELLTEVGVDEVVPWSASRSVARWAGDKVDRGLAKWRATAREAAKQSRRPFVPVVAPLAATAEVAERIRATVAGGGTALVLHEAAGLRLASIRLRPDGDVLLVVGPEGGISDQERTAFEEAGALSARLGPSVLRTSTAGTVAAAVVLASCGRWD